MKKFVCLILCAVLTAGAAVTANAKTVKPHKGVEIYNSAKNIGNNTLLVSAYNIPSDYTNGVLFKGGNTQKNYSMKFADCIDGDKTLFMPSTEKYARYFTSGAGNIYASYTFDNKGGRYVKAKINLHELAPDYFNEDGSHTENFSSVGNHDYKFKYEDLKEGRYFNSALYFQSGGAVTGVVPDRDGCVEIYLSTKINERTDYCTTYSYRTKNAVGGGGGTTGSGVSILRFGNIDLYSTVDVNDVTLLQQYISGEAELDSLQYYYADINFDGKRDVRDVTTLQQAIAGQ